MEGQHWLGLPLKDINKLSTSILLNAGANPDIQDEVANCMALSVCVCVCMCVSMCISVLACG